MNCRFRELVDCRNLKSDPVFDYSITQIPESTSEICNLNQECIPSASSSPDAVRTSSPSRTALMRAAFPTLASPWSSANKSDAPGIATARARGLNALVIPSKGKPREEHDREVVAALKQHNVDLVCLAGYMRLLSPWFVQQFPQRILNIHPSLLPAFPGLEAQEQAFAYGVKVSGCTVHFVDEELDHGAIIVQKTVRCSMAMTNTRWRRAFWSRSTSPTQKRSISCSRNIRSRGATADSQHHRYNRRACRTSHPLTNS